MSTRSDRRKAASILILAALVAAGCAKKKPAQLPPPPAANGASDAGGAGGSAGGMGGVGRGIVPGSRADFLQQAGTDTIHFATDSHDVDQEAQGILSVQAKWLAAHPSVRVTLEGHCDERGTREYNLALGDRRASAAKNALVADGVSPGRITTISYGKERPVAMGSDDSSWAQNRRAVTVVPE